MSSIVFISYRRALSSELAGRIASVLRKRLSGVTTYLDVESIAGGTNFVEAIETHIALADALIVIIPPGWAEVRDAQGRLRLHTPDDHVRAEVAAALKRGVEIVPVLVDRTDMPEAKDLPEDLQSLTAWHAILVQSSLPEADGGRLAEVVRAKIPGRLTALLLQVSALQSGLFLLPYFLIVALILFVAHTLQIHFIPTEATFAGVTGRRDLGLFLAANWTVVLFLLWPLVLYCAHQVLGDAHALIGRIRDRKLIVFLDPDGRPSARSPNELWRRILASGTPAIFALTALSLTLATYNWWDFSGQWSVAAFDETAFLRVSTGVDWQVAWAVDDRFADDAFAIKLLSLICYNLYNFGWIIGYAILVFAAIYFAQLENVAEGSGVYRADRLIVDETDASTGGLDPLDRIQRGLGLVALASAAAMYLMAIRNYFLPPDCQPVSLTDGTVLTAHCFSTFGFFDTSADALGAAISGQGIGAVFTGAAKAANSFTVGTLFAIALTFALFAYVDTKMRRIVRRGRRNTRTADGAVQAAASLEVTLRRRGLLVRALLILTAAALVWPNLTVVCVVVIAAGTLFVLRPAIEA